MEYIVIPIEPEEPETEEDRRLDELAVDRGLANHREALADPEGGFVTLDEILQDLEEKKRREREERGTV